MKRIKIRISGIIIPLLIIILLFSLTIFIIIMPYIRKSFVAKETENIKLLVESQIQILDTMNKSVKNGTISLHHAKAEALSILEDQRYGEKKDFYFWIIDMQPVLLMHPFQKDLEHTYVGNYTDAKGNRLFQEMVDIAKTSGEGYLEYLWEVPYSGGDVLAKKSFVKSYEPWGWIIGTGFYIQRLSSEIRSLFIVITIFSTAVLLLIILISVFLYRQRVKLNTQNLNFKMDLFKSERRYFELLKSMNDGFVVIDSSNRIKLANRKFCDWVGMNETDIAGTDMLDYIDDEFKNAFECNISLRKSGGNDQYELTLIDRNENRTETIVSPRGLFDDDRDYSGSYAVFTDVSMLKNIQNKLTDSLGQKEILIKELHHRVKNNLQIIISLLNFEKTDEVSEKCNDLILRFELRLFSMAIVHELMYESDNFRAVSLKDYINRLIGYLKTESNLSAENFKTQTELIEIHAPTDKATISGLIFAGIMIIMFELFKREKSEKIEFIMKSKESLSKDRYSFEFIYICTGKYPENECPMDGFELNLLENLAQQLNGSFTYSYSADKHISFLLDIPVKEFEDT